MGYSLPSSICAQAAFLTAWPFEMSSNAARVHSTGPCASESICKTATHTRLHLSTVRNTRVASLEPGPTA